MKTLLVTDGVNRGNARLLELLEALREAPPTLVQIREKHLSDRALLDLVVRVRGALPTSVAVLVNGRADIAVAGGAQGVHLPAEGLPPADIRASFPRPFLVSQAVHSVDAALAADPAALDFVLLSPLFPTPSKPGHPGIGVAALEALPAIPPVPVILLGGLREELVAAWPAGLRGRIAGVAGISLFYDAPSPAEVVRRIATL